jgi:hypothetical protein
MKPKPPQKPQKKPTGANPFALPKPQWSHEEDITNLLSRMITAPAPHKDEAQPDTNYLKAVVSIATNFWRARKRMLDITSGEVRQDMRRIHRDVEAIRRSLLGLGIVITYHGDDDFKEGDARIRVVIRDHTGDAYDEGQPMKVVASKPTAALHKKRVSETLLPSIFWNNHLVQNGEIEIETPSGPH